MLTSQPTLTPTPVTRLQSLSPGGHQVINIKAHAWAWEPAQPADYIPSTHKALDSFPSTVHQSGAVVPTHFSAQYSRGKQSESEAKGWMSRCCSAQPDKPSLISGKKRTDACKLFSDSTHTLWCACTHTYNHTNTHTHTSTQTIS